MGVLLSRDERLSRLREKYPNLDFSKSEYFGVKHPMTAVCPKHGEITKLGTHWNVNGCQSCGKEKSASKSIKRTVAWRNESERKRIAVSETWDKFILDNTHWLDATGVRYVSSRAKATVRCVIHDIVFEGTFRNLMKGKSACPKCVGEKITKSRVNSPDKNLRNARKVHGNEYEYQRIPVLLHDKAEIVCKKHGVFEQAFHNHLQGMGCPYCTYVVSSHEKEVADYVKSLVPDVVTRCRSVISPKEIDIFVPSRDLGIEFHGLHWHADDREGTTLYDKWRLCKDRGIRLIQVFEDEWIEKRQMVERTIRAALGMSDSVGARALMITEWTSDASNRFLNEFHISGGSSGSYRIGLSTTDGKPVAVLVCGKSRFTDHTWEVLRYASDGHVAGGFQRLFSRFTKDVGADECVSYCDLRYGVGTIYENSGFVDVGVTPPDYWWFKKQKRVSRYQTQKHRLKSDPRFSDAYSIDKTESQICVDSGYRKITGVGHRKFIWTRKLTCTHP